MQMREKVGKSRNIVFFQGFVAPEGRKVGSLKRRLRSQLARWEMKNCTPLVHEAHFEVKMYKAHQVRTTFGSWDVEKVHAVAAAKHISKSKCTKHTRSGPLFGSWDVEKVHAVVARSTFRSQNVKNTRGSDHLWKFRCRKSVRRCGAKHISKSKCQKHEGFGPLLEVASRGRRKGLCTLSKVRKTWGFCSIFNYNHHYTTLHSNTLHYTTTTTTPSLHSTTLHSTTLYCTQLHSITLHYTPLHSTTLNYTPLH